MRVQSIGLLIFACTSLGTAATIRKEIHIDAESTAVWDAVRDFDNVDKRLVPGFVVKVQAEDGARVVTFANGATARELLVSIDDNLRRLAYAIPDGSFKTYSASVQVFPEGEHRCLLVWIVDLLPNSFESYIKTQMDSAAMIIKGTLEKTSRKQSALPDCRATPGTEWGIGGPYAS
jgi:carbon monoxide dehydrogenase subunit G